MDQVPHRGYFHEFTWRSEFEHQTLYKLRSTLFTGMTLLQRDSRNVGVLVFITGQLIHAVVDSHQERDALRALLSDTSINRFQSKRMTRSVVVAASSLINGEPRKLWDQASPPNWPDVQAQIPPQFTGTLVWLGATPHVCVYTEGQRVHDSQLPDPGTPGPLLQFTASQASHEDLFEFSGTATPAATLKTTTPETMTVIQPPAGQNVDTEWTWQVAYVVYDQQLGRAARPALERLRADLGHLEGEALITSVKQRLNAAFGAAAMTAFERRIGR